MFSEGQGGALNESLNKNVTVDFTEATSLEIAYKYRVSADKAEVFFTDILKQFPFPELKDNKFVPEALVWNRIAKAGYKFIWNTKVIYICDYLNDGYTKNFDLNLRKNPDGFALYYKECLSYKEIPLKAKCKSIICLLQCKVYSARKGEK